MNITRSMSGLTLLFVLSLVCSFTPTAIAQNYYPSEIGNTWVFLSVDRTEQRTYTLEGPENINGQELTVLKITRETPGTDAAAIDDKYFITVDSDGGLILHQSAVDQGTFGVAEATYDPPAPFFPAVLPIGRKWEIVAEVVLKIVGPTTSVSTIEVVDIEDIETPIGTFKDCVKLQITRKVTTALGIQRYNLVQWLAPEVGPVKYLDADQDILFELESYELVEAPSADDAAADDTADAADDATADADTVSDDAADDTAADDTSADIISDDAAADDTAVDDTAEEDAADDADAAEEDAADDAVEEDAAVDDTAEEDAAVDDATAEPVVEEPMPEPEPVSYGFDVTLAPGLNMMSVPLMPEEPYTAKSLAEMLGATVVIQFDVGTQSFTGYTVADSGDGFGIEGGEGYIVNTPAGASVKFTGSAWDNQPEPEPVVEEPAAEEEVAEEPAADDAAEEVAEEPAADGAAEEVAEEPAADDAVEEVAEEPAADDAAEEVAEEPAADDAAEEVADDAAADAVVEEVADDAAADAVVEEVADDAAAAPALSTFKSAWAFVVTSDIQGMETGRTYTLVAENLRTGSIATQNLHTGARRSSAVWADLNRKSVVEAGDKLKVALYDDRGRVVSGPFQRTVATTDIGNAFLSMDLRVGDVRPQETVLAQNFPNPFNPETWIPYQLSKATEVSIQIYDVSGRLIRMLDLGWQPVGSYMTPSSAAYWDGRNAVGERVASGIYFYTLQTADFAATRRMVILK